MDEMDVFRKKIKKAILKLKNGSASSEEISLEFTSAIDKYIKTIISSPEN